MNQKRPFVLISNDDGYHAPGIRLLADTMSSFADVLVVAPESGRSGSSCAFSASNFLLLKRRKDIATAQVWSCTGTPADCIKMATDQLCPDRRPDLVLSGVNHGDNSTVNVHYSGTMGVALEGCLKGIPSIGFSTCYYNTDANLEPLRPYILKIVRRVLADGLPHGVCLNVNFPARQEFRGVRACRMTRGEWVNEIVKRQHPHGYDYYWVVGKYENHEPDAQDTDQWALNNGYISITPTQIDVTAYDFMKQVEGWDFSEM